MKSSYKSLAIEVSIHFVIMYAVMYTMVYSLDEVYLNNNNLYMTGMMVAPMVSLMLITMRHMFHNQKINLILHGLAVLVFVAFFFFERNQTFIGDEQFIKSMIPHHSGALLMCEKAQLTDQELKTLCAQIIEGQTKEIRQLKDILARMEEK